ncbi:Replication factor C, subunit RFC4 [Savitreella phatthalungensis]
MKILTKQEEDEHYSHVLEGGLKGGAMGLGVGMAGLLAARRFSSGVRSLTIPFQAFLVTGVTTFSLIIGADRYSRNYERKIWEKYGERESIVTTGAQGGLLHTANQYRWHLVGGSWLAGMAGSLTAVSRNRYLSTSQKLVQARMYAQGITLAVLLISAVIATADTGEQDTGEDSIVKDPSTGKAMRVHHAHKETYAGENQWQDMIAAEDARLKARGESVSGRS